MHSIKIFRYWMIVAGPVWSKAPHPTLHNPADKPSLLRETSSPSLADICAHEPPCDHSCMVTEQWPLSMTQYLSLLNLADQSLKAGSPLCNCHFWRPNVWLTVVAYSTSPKVVFRVAQQLL